MTETARALQDFFGSFGLSAFVEFDVPKKAELPYITYQLVEPNWRDSATLYARAWYRSKSFVDINAKVDQIKRAVGEGIPLSTESGVIWLFKGNPFAQNMPMQGDPTLRVIYLNFNIHALTD